MPGNSVSAGAPDRKNKLYVCVVVTGKTLPVSGSVVVPLVGTVRTNVAFASEESAEAMT